MIEREQYYINELKPDVNVLKIAGSSLGYKHKETDLQRIRDFNRSLTSRQSWIKGTSKTRFKKGIKLSEEAREAMSQRCKINPPFKGKLHSKESKQKMSAKAKQRDYSKYDLTKFIDAGIKAAKKPVLKMDKQWNILARYESVTDAIKEYNTKQTRHLVECCKGHKEFYKKHRWRFANNCNKTVIDAI